MHQANNEDYHHAEVIGEDLSQRQKCTFVRELDLNIKVLTQAKENQRNGM